MTDSIAELQGKILELSELMYNSLGLIQRDSAPLPFDDKSSVPNSLGQSSIEKWKKAREDQGTARKDFVEQIISCCKSIDNLGDTLPELKNEQNKELDELMKELSQVEAKLEEKLKKASAVLKRVRECKEGELETYMSQKKVKE